MVGQNMLNLEFAFFYFFSPMEISSVALGLAQCNTSFQSQAEIQSAAMQSSLGTFRW